MGAICYILQYVYEDLLCFAVCAEIDNYNIRCYIGRYGKDL